mmetsp:Transcript_21150/g.47424  ORF Transcript_21150/g.47424 Transcript_21150/m.47424 type:complete len:112 (+) Transcript_21150:929-1264(+)
MVQHTHVCHVSSGWRVREMWECVGRPVRQPCCRWVCVWGAARMCTELPGNRWNPWKKGMFSEQTRKSTNRMSTQRQTLIFDAKTPSMSEADDVSPMTIDVPVTENVAKVCD